MIPQQSDLIRSNRNLLNLEFRKVFLAQNSLLVFLWTDLLRLAAVDAQYLKGDLEVKSYLMHIWIPQCFQTANFTTRLRNVKIKTGGKRTVLRTDKSFFHMQRCTRSNQMLFFEKRDAFRVM